MPLAQVIRAVTLLEATHSWPSGMPRRQGCHILPKPPPTPPFSHPAGSNQPAKPPRRPRRCGSSATNKPAGSHASGWRANSSNVFRSLGWHPSAITERCGSSLKRAANTHPTDPARRSLGRTQKISSLRAIFVETVADQASTKVSINTFVSYCIRSHRCPNDISSCVPEQTDY
jgi:hypothetical protein